MAPKNRSQFREQQAQQYPQPVAPVAERGLTQAGLRGRGVQDRNRELEDRIINRFAPTPPKTNRTGNLLPGEGDYGGAPVIPGVNSPVDVFDNTANTVAQDGDQTGVNTPGSTNWDFIQGLYDQSIAARQAGVDKQESAAMNALGALETTMNRQLGQQQLTNERDIANRRMMAVRSGMSPTNLAAQEMQNLMAGQVGATQIAEQYNEGRTGLMTEFAGQREMAESYGIGDMVQGFLQDRSMDVQGAIGEGANTQQQDIMQWLMDQGILSKDQLGDTIAGEN